MDKKDFLKPKPKQQSAVTFNMPMEVDRELIDAHFKALTSKIEINVAEQLKAVLQAVEEIKAAVEKMPKWEKQEFPEPKEIDLTPLIEAINRPRKKTITAKRGEHGLIDLASVVIKDE